MYKIFFYIYLFCIILLQYYVLIRTQLGPPIRFHTSHKEPIPFYHSSQTLRVKGVGFDKVLPKNGNELDLGRILESPSTSPFIIYITSPSPSPSDLEFLSSFLHP